MDNRQLYPDFLRASAIAKIVVFHFVGWQLLTYIPSLGIMFALAGWFVANSLKSNSGLVVIYHRLVRLLPTWWAFASVTLIAGFFYAKGEGIQLQTTFAWLFPYEKVTWNLDNSYAEDVIVVTWYISAYLTLVLLSPLLMYAYKKLSWVAIFVPVIVMVIYTQFSSYELTVYGENWYQVLMFSGCWMLGFAKADNSINNVPRYVIWTTAIFCVACGIFLTWDTQSLSSNSIALSVMSFGVAFLLLSFNPNLTNMPHWIKAVIRATNTYAVTIYLFHNILIDCAYGIGNYFHVYEIGNYIHAYEYGDNIGQSLCFVILLGLIYVAVKTIGIVETHKWVQKATTKESSSIIAAKAVEVSQN